MKMGSMRRHRRGSKPVADINLTSLLDVAFVLLIAFMLVAPSLKYGEELELPVMRDGAPQLSTDQANLATIVISKALAGSITGARQYLLNGEALEVGELETRLRDLNKNPARKLQVEVQADKETPYDSFVQVVGALRRAGIETVGLPVDANST